MTIHPEMTALAVQFFARFARFEFALKRAGFYRRGVENSVKADWERFVQQQEVAALFDEMRTTPVIAYIINNPPKRRVLCGKVLAWENAAPPTDMLGLCNAMKRVRNNLFHGDKSNPGLSRNVQLFEASNAILERLLNTNDSVKIEYESNEDMA